MGVRDPQIAGRRVFQSSLPFKTPQEGTDVRKANGLLLSGVVTATYVLDDPEHPWTNDGIKTNSDPVEIFCDVLIYSNIPGLRTKFIPQVRVSQPRGGVHDGEIWKPKPTSFNITNGAAFTVDDTGNTKALNPALMDGDHVVIGFLNDDIDEPIVLRYLSHPSIDEGSRENKLGHRKRLIVEDGDPYFMRHHGTYFGVEDSGNFKVSTLGAHDGVTTGDGKEPPQDNTKGGQTFELPEDATFKVNFVDGQGDRTLDPIDKTITLTMDKTGFQIELGGETLLVQDKDGLATLKIGDGSAHATLWEDLKAFINNFITTEYDTHTHPTGVGPSGAPIVSGTAATDTDGQADKITIPVN